MSDRKREHANLLATIEAASAAAWPALEEICLDGCRLRLSRGFTRRANSVQPPLDGKAPGAALVEQCERVYAQAGLPCIFRLLSLGTHAPLDALLTARGYGREGETAVLAGGLPSPALRKAAPQVTWADPGSASWRAALAGLTGVPESSRAELAALLDRVSAPHSGLLITVAGAAAAIARGVVSGGWLGIFDLATHPGHRSRGYARALMAAVMDWGMDQGARRAYLQVETGNQAAGSLYRELGFEEVYRYVYRVRRE